MDSSSAKQKPRKQVRRCPLPWRASKSRPPRNQTLWTLSLTLPVVTMRSAVRPGCKEQARGKDGTHHQHAKWQRQKPQMSCWCPPLLPKCPCRTHCHRTRALELGQHPRKHQRKLARWERPPVSVGEVIGSDIATFEPDKPDDPYLARMFIVTEQRMGASTSVIQKPYAREALPLAEYIVVDSLLWDPHSWQ